MASEISATPTAEQWLEEENLMLLECWARDGYTFIDIANRIGIANSTLCAWRNKYPEIERALKAGREIVDYKVENALLKSALGYRTKEVKVTTVIRYGKVVETIKEVTDREQAPNVSAAQCWLYNRLPKKWKNMNSRANILEDLGDEDTTIQVTVTRASKNPNAQNAPMDPSKEVDNDWVDEINESIEIRSMTEEEKKEANKAKDKNKTKEKTDETEKANTKVESEPEDDLDYWPEDWEEDEEDWEE